LIKNSKSKIKKGFLTMDLKTLKANAVALNLKTEKQLQEEKDYFLKEFDAQSTVENALTRYLAGDNSLLYWKKPAWLSKETMSVTLNITLSDVQKQLLEEYITHRGQKGYQLAINAFDQVIIQGTDISCLSITRIDRNTLKSLYQKISARVVIKMPKNQVKN
jgi:hypothetical protein